MASPITVGTTAIVAVAKNPQRAKVRFQNVSKTQTLYFVRQIHSHIVNTPSATKYDFLLAPGVTAEVNEAYIETNSISRFNVVSSASGGELAIFETQYV